MVQFAIGLGMRYMLRRLAPTMASMSMNMVKPMARRSLKALKSMARMPFNLFSNVKSRKPLPKGRAMNVDRDRDRNFDNAAAMDPSRAGIVEQLAGLALFDGLVAVFEEFRRLLMNKRQKEQGLEQEQTEQKQQGQTQKQPSVQRNFAFKNRFSSMFKPRHITKNETKNEPSVAGKVVRFPAPAPFRLEP